MILIFAGAGASAAIDENQYPTTQKFAEKMDVRSEIVTRIIQFIKQNKESPPDVEKILNHIETLLDHYVDCANPERVQHHVIYSDNRVTMGPNRNNLQDPFWQSFIENLRRQFQELMRTQETIHGLIHGFYSKLPTKKQQHLWATLISTIHQWSLRTDLFTTNYDLVLETVLRDNKFDHIILGVKPDRPTGEQLDLDYWSPDSGKMQKLHRNGQGILTKLHGRLVGNTAQIETLKLVKMIPKIPAFKLSYILVLREFRNPTRSGIFIVIIAWLPITAKLPFLLGFRLEMPQSDLLRLTWR